MKSWPDPRFPRWFAVVGFALVSLLAAVVVLELLSWTAVSAYHIDEVHSGPLGNELAAKAIRPVR